MAAANLGPLYHTLVIARLTFRESRRRRLIWIGLGLGVVFSTLFTLGFYFAYRDVTTQDLNQLLLRQFSNVFMMAGLYVVNFLVVMVAVLTSVGTIAQEVSTNTIHAIAAKPIRRWEIVMGKWLGHATLLTAYTALMCAGVMIPVYVIAGYLPPNPLPGVLILTLESLTVLSVTMLASTLFNTLPAGLVAFMLYGVAFVGGWVEQIGALLESQTAQDIGVASSLLMPSEGLWRYAAGLMQGSGGLTSSLTPFSVTSQPSQAFAFYAVGYTLVLLGLAIWAFSEKDF